MSQELFDLRDVDDRFFIPKIFFNSINDILFSKRIKRLLSGVGVEDEYHACYFPDDRDSDEENFDGVKFRYKEKLQVVSKSDFRVLVKDACKNYKSINPELTKEIDEVLSKMSDR